MYEKKVLIIECIPKTERMKEGQILKEVLRLIFGDSSCFCYKEIKSRGNLLSYIKNKRDLDEYDFIHISAHGSDGLGIVTPNGTVYPTEFKSDCFDGKTLTISACSLGNRDFAGHLIYFTSANNVIAPSKDVEFSNAAIWFVNFYFLVLKRGRKAKTAFDTCKERLRGLVGGDFEFFDYSEVQDVIDEIEANI